MALKPSSDFRQAVFRLADVFSCTDQPTLIVDLRHLSDRGVHIDFANDAFKGQYGVILRIIISNAQTLEPSFLEWFGSSSTRDTPYLLGDLSWRSFIVDERWKVVNVTQVSAQQYPASSPQSETPRSHDTADRISPSPINAPSPVESYTGGSPLTGSLPPGRGNLGRAPTALEGLHRSLAVEMLGIGFFEYDLEGTLIFGNSSFYALSGHPTNSDAHTELRFLDLCHPDDIPPINTAWAGLLEDKPVTFDMRWKHMPSESARALGAQWISAACLPLYDKGGVIRSISGCTANINQVKMSEEIARSRAEALERARIFEKRFIKFAMVAPIVIFNFDTMQRMTYCNERWFEMTAKEKGPIEEVNFADAFLDEDVVKLFSMVHKSTENREVISLEMRMKKDWLASDGSTQQAFGQITTFSEVCKDGNYQGCTGTLHDISERKYAELLQRAQLADVTESRRQKENFIDTISHEMRNPLSAMMQSTDSAKTAVDEIGKMNALISTPDERISQQVTIALNGLGTINTCCAHQKSLVDDVLTLSKMDSNLLAITPVEVRPSQCMDEVISMFRLDAQVAGTDLKTVVDQSVHEYCIEWLMFDPSRVKQILVNLVSNAIKFTRHQHVREIEVHMSAALQSPNLNKRGIGSGEVVYLEFSVRDTGRGISEQEQRRLFQRYSQASPVTHVHYGGSGIGLYISRQLTELQGGEIGVISQELQGSTFAFYIQSRRAVVAKSTERPALGPSHNPSDVLSATSPSQRTAVSTSSTESRRLSGAGRDETANTISVLIVEDNLVNQKVLRTQLERRGYRVYVAGHGLEALHLLEHTDLWYGLDESDSPALTGSSVTPGTTLHTAKMEASSVTGTIDIILMDIEMPVMNGLTCTRTIRDLERRGTIRSRTNFHRLPIISTSANVRQEKITAQMEAGIDDILTKPFKIAALLDKIQKLTEPGRRSGPGHT